MSQSRASSNFAGPGIMLISAVIFGFFGFMYVNWNTPGVNGQLVPFRLICGWTLKIASVSFFVCALLTFVKPMVANVLYAVVGLISAALFVVVAILDLADQQHAIMAYGPFILFLFAAWNGYGSWIALKDLMAQRLQPSKDLLDVPDQSLP